MLLVTCRLALVMNGDHTGRARLSRSFSCETSAARRLSGQIDTRSRRGVRSQALGLTCAKIRKLGSPSGSSLNSGLTQPRSSSVPRSRPRPRPGTSAAAAGSCAPLRTRRAPRLRASGRGRSRHRRPFACSRRRSAPARRTSTGTGSRAPRTPTGTRLCRNGPRTGGTRPHPEDGEGALAERPRGAASCCYCRRGWAPSQVLTTQKKILGRGGQAAASRRSAMLRTSICVNA